MEIILPDNRTKLLKYLKYALIIVASAAGVYLFFKYLFIWLLPFIIAWIIAALIQPAVKFATTKTKLKTKPATIIILLILFAIVIALIFFLISRIINEVTSLSQTVLLNLDSITKYIDGLFDSVEKYTEEVPFLKDNGIFSSLKIQLENMTGSFIASTGAFLASKLPDLFTAAATSLPSILIFTIILLISTFYIGTDYTAINSFIMIQLPKKIHNILIDIKNKFLETIYKYIKAYSIIIFITYCELAVGLLIIGVNYAFLLAALIAFIDILPILGSGAVLIPWGVINIIQKDYFHGFGLLILYAVISVIRQIIEPKIVGKSIGLYPVVTLISLYVGFHLFGVAGMFLLPIFILILKNLNDEGKIKIWKMPDKSKKKIAREKNNGIIRRSK